MKKILAVTLALLMSLSCFSIISFAEEGETVEHLTEVPEGYIGVYTKDDLNAIRENLSKNYILMSDIVFEESDFSEKGTFYNFGTFWAPIGNSSAPFTGVFNGNGYKIENLKINRPTQSCIGLFGYIKKGTITNLRLINVDITGKNSVGGACGYAETDNTIDNILVSGNINGSEDVGGICGALNSNNEEKIAVTKCINISNVSAEYFAGGIIGKAECNSSDSYRRIKISNCINEGSITATGYAAGGILGYNSQKDIEVIYSFNTGRTSAPSRSAGIAAYSCYSVTYCYSIGFSDADGIATNVQLGKNCYYASDVGTVSSNTTIARTLNQLKKQTTYEGWDFDTVWTMEGREDYPYPELRDVPLVLPEDLMHKHEYDSEITKEATHTDEGEMTYTCECGDTYTAEIPKLDIHSYTEIVTPPICTEDGFVTYTCVCGDTYTEIIPSEGHNEIILPKVEATCTEDGLTEGLGCSKCNEIFTAQEVIPAFGHNEVIDKAIESTCTKTGLTEGKHCDVCNVVTVVQEIIPAFGHKEIYTSYVEPTCTETGLSVGKICENCDEVLISVQIIPAKGHRLSDWIVTSEATCETNGKKIKICACGLIEEESIPSMGHSDADNDEICDNCSQSLSSNTQVTIEKDNVFTFLKSFLNNLIDLIKKLLKL